MLGRRTVRSGAIFSERSLARGLSTSELAPDMALAEHMGDLKPRPYGCSVKYRD
jgi:hypothetical protein